MSERVDTLIRGALVVTMNPQRDVITDGAVAIRGTQIVGVGKTTALDARVEAHDVVDGRSFVVTPGMVNTHIHVTGEPLTRGFVPDDLPFEVKVFEWLCPLYASFTEEDERVSAQLSAAEMLKSGTTAFLEAGTVRFVDAVVDGLVEVGIRARLGRWIWDRVPEPDVYRQTTDEAIASLEHTVRTHRSVENGRIQAWAALVGHTTCSDPLWRAAKEIADRYETGLTFHMSPHETDPAEFLTRFGCRPIEHLERLGVLGPNVVLAHCIHVDDVEVSLLGVTRCHVAHCPTTALKSACGVTQVGKVPEMVGAGVNLTIGTDASSFSDLMRAVHLVAGLFKDARLDTSIFPAEQVYEMATLGGARAILADDDIGSIEVGKKADLVLHDRERPEWTPLLDVANQLVWAADGRGVHTVFVDGRRVVDAYRLTTVDEGDLYRRAQDAAMAILQRSGLPRSATWTPI